MYFLLLPYLLVSGSFPSSPPPQASPTPLIAASPAQLSSSTPPKGNHQNYHLSLVPSIGIAVTALASVMLVVLIILIRKKRRELDDSDTDDKTSSKSIPCAARKFQDGTF